MALEPPRVVAGRPVGVEHQTVRPVGKRELGLRVFMPPLGPSSQSRRKILSGSAKLYSAPLNSQPLLPALRWQVELRFPRICRCSDRVGCSDGSPVWQRPPHRAQPSTSSSPEVCLASATHGLVERPAARGAVAAYHGPGIVLQHSDGTGTDEGVVDDRTIRRAIDPYAVVHATRSLVNRHGVPYDVDAGHRADLYASRFELVVLSRIVTDP